MFTQIRRLPRLAAGLSTLPRPQRCFISKRAKSDFTVSRLDHRAVVELSGSETIEFMQGLVTNDLYELEKSACMYAMMLNTQGRIEHDLLISQHADDALLLDCSRGSLEKLVKTIKRYKLRKKISVAVRDDLHVWQAMEASGKTPGLGDLVAALKTNQQQLFLSFEDPRTSAMGHRLICDADKLEQDTVSSDVYHSFRYGVGVPEGSDDLIPGKSSPLESNLEFMNGVSFQKGCYVGQELTARTHFTGVIRKRLTPFIINDGSSVEVGEKIPAPGKSKRSAGKVVSTFGNVGLGLVRLEYLLPKQPLVTKGGVELNCFQPSWWPEIKKEDKL